MSRGRWPALLLVPLALCALTSLCVLCLGGLWFVAGTDVGSVGQYGGPGSSASGALRLSGGEPRTLDPALIRYTVSAEFVVEIFSGLVTLDPNLEVVPDLAERWDLSPDGRSYTFYLREDALFHDGRPVTASDVKFSLERACHPDTGSLVAGGYLGDIVGAQEMLNGQSDDLSGVEIVDDHTVRITIDAPKAYFLAKLTYPTAFVVDENNLGGENWFLQPNGTGPFRLVEYSTERIVLQRNERFYREAPHVERVVYSLSGGSPVNMYENGELDVAYVGSADVQRVRDPDNPLHGDLEIVPQLDVYYLAFDVRQPPFTDARVRQAFAWAVDREKLTGVVLDGMAVSADGIVPPGMPAFQRSGALLGFDPQRAQSLLAQSSYGSAAALPPVTLTIAGDSGELPQHIAALAAMFREVLGVTVHVEQAEDVFEILPQFYVGGWSADYPDPENFLDILFHSASDLNHMGYANAELDRLLELARVERDAQRRMELYRQAEEMIVADAPWIPLWHSVDYVLAKPYVKGLTMGASIFPWLSLVEIEQ